MMPQRGDTARNGAARILSLAVFIVALSGCVGSRSGPVVPDMVYELELDATQLRIAVPSAGLSGQYPPPKPPGRYALSSSDPRLAERRRSRTMFNAFYDFGGPLRIKDGTFSVRVVAVPMWGDPAPEGSEAYIQFLRQRFDFSEDYHHASVAKVAGVTWFRFNNWPQGNRDVIQGYSDIDDHYILPVNDDAVLLLLFSFSGNSGARDEDWMARAFLIAEAILALIEVDP